MNFIAKLKTYKDLALVDEGPVRFTLPDLSRRGDEGRVDWVSVLAEARRLFPPHPFTGNNDFMRDPHRISLNQLHRQWAWQDPSWGPNDYVILDVEVDRGEG